VDWRSTTIETAWRHPLLWRGLKALHPGYTAARCRLRRRPRLRWVGFEVTNRCNLACVMCGSRTSTRERGLMPPEVFDEMLAQIPDGSLACVTLHSVGEPLLHPDIERFARSARPKAAELFLSTNGLLFHRDRALMRRLLDAGLTHVHFSAEGYDAATYESVRIGGSFEELIGNLRLFRRERDASGSRAAIHVQYTLFRPHTADEIRRVKETFGPHVDAIEFRPLNNQSMAGIAHRPQESIAGVRCFADEPLPCLALWCGLTVLWDGRLSLCPRGRDGDLVIAHHGEPLDAAWSGETARRLRALHSRRCFPQACHHCSDPHARTLAVLELDRRLNAIGGAP
jgi:pyruvate-formate lyase-activating enzyme